jgi:hypothetical protein
MFGGLYLEVSTSGGKLWRFLSTGLEARRSCLPQGAYPNAGLKAAREKAGEARKLLNSGVG